MSTLADILGLKADEAYEFDNKIIQLEAKIAGQTSIASKITAKIYENSALGLQAIGFEKGEVTGQEAFVALKNLFQKNDDLSDEFWENHRATIFFTVDGLISANKRDVELSLEDDLEFSQRRLHGARQEILKNLAKLYDEKMIYSSEKEIIEELTN